MSKSITASDSKSIEYEHPAFELGKTVFYKEHDGTWHSAKFVCDDAPKGWGFATIKYGILGQPIVKSVPYVTLFSRQDYLAQRAEEERINQIAS